MQSHSPVGVAQLWIVSTWNGMRSIELIQRVVERPMKRAVERDGRIRCWAPIAEMDGRYLGVLLLRDGQSGHNAFFDRWFTP